MWCCFICSFSCKQKCRSIPQQVHSPAPVRICLGHSLLHWLPPRYWANVFPCYLPPTPFWICFSFLVFSSFSLTHLQSQAASQHTFSFWLNSSNPAQIYHLTLNFLLSPQTLISIISFCGYSGTKSEFTSLKQSTARWIHSFKALPLRGSIITSNNEWTLGGSYEVCMMNLWNHHVSPHPSPHSSSAKVELVGHGKTKVCKVEIKLSITIS